ncbi:MAG: M1 family aminopeptidase [Burkholderiales bacterium]
MVLRALFALALLAVPAYAGQNAPADPITLLVERLEQAGAAGEAAAILALGMAPDVPGLRVFADYLSPKPVRFVVKERDRAELPTGGDRLLIEVFAQFGNEAVISTWRVDLDSAAADAPRQIAGLEQLTLVSGLYRLALNPTKQFAVRNLTVQATDLTLELPAGQAFVAEIDEGPTAVVLLGRGRIRFAPADAAERTQVRIFSGEDVLATEFDAVFVRIRPAEFSRTFAESSLVPREVDAGDLRRAVDMFDDQIGQTLNLDLTDLSRERWSLVPNPRDLIVEIRTRRMGQLTYARSGKDAEDISFFDRRRRRNIAIYASEQKLASRGRFYSEDDLADYDVLRYDIDASFTPDRMWVDGNARIKIRIRAYALTAITLRLAEPLAVRAIVSPQYGRLLFLRVVGQNSVIVNFPTSLSRDTELWVNIVYGGRLEPQLIDRESLFVSDQQQAAQVQEQVYIPIEPHYVYSNRSYWYPQAPITDYATAHLRVTVPPDLAVVATGIADGPPAPAPGGVEPGERARRLFVFSAEYPVRYLACIISRFDGVGSRSIPVAVSTPRQSASTHGIERQASGTPQADTVPAAQAGANVILSVVANPRQTGRARSLADRTASIVQYYAKILGDAPYPAFTLAVTEDELPGGHSPGYFAMLNQPPPISSLVWRNDPVAFDSYGPYFLAHEIAHQWWGQAVGWKNYHEQWLSEGFAQYFAFLYAGADRGDDLQRGMLRQMRRWAIEESDQGPVYLGYRLGHIRGESRVFRAVIYNKGAMVLHMLRRFVGDGCFFAGVRQFYRDWRFRKAGTDDFRLAMEHTCGGDLAPFFEAWIYGTAIPSLRFSSTISGSQATVRLEQRQAVVPVPVTVTVTYNDGTTDEIVVPITERVVERTVPLRGGVRSIDANKDYASLAEIDR